MTTPRDTPASRRSHANGDGTVYQRKDTRWEAAGYVLAPGNTRKRVRVYGTTLKDALAKLTEKIANSNRGLPIPSAQDSVAAYLAYWLDAVAVHQLRENTHTRYTAVARLYIIPGLGKRKLAKLTAKDIRPGSTSSAPPASAAPAAATPPVTNPSAAPPESAAPSGSRP